MKNLDQFLTLNLDQFLTLKPPNLGPIFNFTKNIYIYIIILYYIILCVYIYIYVGERTTGRVFGGFDPKELNNGTRLHQITGRASFRTTKIGFQGLLGDSS